ncbi:hypothetical protein Nepgr_004335 [Nepenthes gracilis]|uniref:Uncharacterized protein n=1 Tax=Nepenthes gracilis TaxID=150966 RepID=A0AAD3S1G5_NEPGR|nr:hypothetical protein Nepgr_004335 [Nepenthes gracilis]
MFGKKLPENSKKKNELLRFGTLPCSVFVGIATSISATSNSEEKFRQPRVKNPSFNDWRALRLSYIFALILCLYFWSRWMHSCLYGDAKKSFTGDAKVFHRNLLCHRRSCKHFWILIGYST